MSTHYGPSSINGGIEAGGWHAGQERNPIPTGRNCRLSRLAQLAVGALLRPNATSELVAYGRASAKGVLE